MDEDKDKNKDKNKDKIYKKILSTDEIYCIKSEREKCRYNLSIEKQDKILSMMVKEYNECLITNYGTHYRGQRVIGMKINIYWCDVHVNDDLLKVIFKFDKLLNVEHYKILRNKICNVTDSSRRNYIELIVTSENYVEVENNSYCVIN